MRAETTAPRRGPGTGDRPPWPRHRVDHHRRLLHRAAGLRLQQRVGASAAPVSWPSASKAPAFALVVPMSRPTRTSIAHIRSRGSETLITQIPRGFYPRVLSGFGYVAPTDSLRGKLLVAAPQLEDYFHRTVVLVLEHTDEGAMGLVLNRPTESEVIEAVPSLSDLVDSSDLVHAGGPSAARLRVLVLGDFEEPEDAGAPGGGHAGAAGPRAARGRAEPRARVRRLRRLGRRGSWTCELEQEAWIVVPGRPRRRPSARRTCGATRCGARVASTRCWPRLPADPSLN